MTVKKMNITRHEGKVTKEERCSRNQANSVLIWLTGLSASGKSTIAYELERLLFDAGRSVYVLDGDNVRYGLNKDLGFSEDDRRENLRRIGEIAKLFVDAGVITIAAFISPYRYDRRMIRSLFSEKGFIEIYVRCPLEVCEERDPKGLYKKARKGEIPNFTGVSDPYEIPEHPELIVDTSLLSADESVDMIFQYIKAKKIIDN
ncbi:MAG: adenylyl-sulfate kinase [Nitrospirae bacterium]|nr:adenylyl-sulfate kinase [Nitrospirota bacterium]